MSGIVVDNAADQAICDALGNATFNTIGVSYTEIGTKLIAAANATSGVIADICASDFSAGLLAVATNILVQSTAVRLASVPDPDDDRRVRERRHSSPNDPNNGWTYDSASTSIFFHGSALPVGLEHFHRRRFHTGVSRELDGPGRTLRTAGGSNDPLSASAPDRDHRECFSATIIAERTIALFFKYAIDAKLFMGQIETLLARGNVQGALDLCASNPQGAARQRRQERSSPSQSRRGRDQDLGRGLADRCFRAW